MAQKLLLADDSVTIQRVIELTFADEDIEVVSVGDGQLAIERIVAERPDIVLADVGMPRRDGYEVARFIKGNPAFAHIPVLLLTGAFEPVDEARARGAGCDGVLAKPFEPQMLIARVRELLAASASGAASIARPAPDGIAQGAVAVPASPAGPGGVRLAAAAPQAGASDAERQPAVTPTATPDQPAASEPAGPGMSLDEYFDRLDAAFANLGPSVPTPAPPGAFGRSPLEDLTSMPHPAEDAGELDLDLSAWISPAGGSAQVPASGDREQGLEAGEDVPGEAAVRHDTFGPQPQAPVEPALAERSGPVPAASAASVLDETAAYAGPPLADVFSAFLAAEHGEPVPPSVSESMGRTLVMSDALIEQVSGRVLERLGDRAIQETVADVVSQVAERVVREEIDRLKSTLR